MPWHLDSVEGPSSSRKVDLKPAATVTIGKSAGVNHFFNEDPEMSPVHFALSCVGGSVRLQNLSKTVGTEVNGELVEGILLQAGDRIRAGQTVFVLHAPRPSPYPALVRIGGWGFESGPEGWQPVEGVGFHTVSADSFRANITAVEEPLPAGQTLQSYEETQIELARTEIPEISIERAVPINVRGSNEALTVSIAIPRHFGFRVLQRQVYALSSDIVGIFTATVSESEPHAEALDAVIHGLSYFQG